MSKHSEIGTNGERIAVNFLKNKGFSIRETNWRSGKKEVDIIAENETFLVFVEVKTRSGFRFGYPEEAVTDRKKTYLKNAAEAYFEHCGINKPIRFDIISIIKKRSGTDDELIHIEDAFY